MDPGYRLNSENYRDTGQVDLQKSHATRRTSILYAVSVKVGLCLLRILEGREENDDD